MWENSGLNFAELRMNLLSIIFLLMVLHENVLSIHCSSRKECEIACLFVRAAVSLRDMERKEGHVEPPIIYLEVQMTSRRTISRKESVVALVQWGSGSLLCHAISPPPPGRSSVAVVGGLYSKMYFWSLWRFRS